MNGQAVLALGALRSASVLNLVEPGLALDGVFHKVRTQGLGVNVSSRQEFAGQSPVLGQLGCGVPPRCAASRYLGDICRALPQ